MERKRAGLRYGNRKGQPKVSGSVYLDTYRIDGAVNQETDRQLDQCVHHWKIETPNGAVSTGICKKCGDTKPYNNSGIPVRNDLKAVEAVVSEKIVPEEVSAEVSIINIDLKGTTLA